MILHFLRTGEKRYAIEVERNGLPALEMNPAPGYDPLVPHDMMHLVVEAVLGLERAVFGQIASGGDAGSFHMKQGGAGSGREASRRRRKQKQRGAKLRDLEAGDFGISERATYVCWQVWLHALKRMKTSGRRHRCWKRPKGYDLVCLKQRGKALRAASMKFAGISMN
jgi:hypothetical protein